MGGLSTPVSRDQPNDQPRTNAEYGTIVCYSLVSYVDHDMRALTLLPLLYIPIALAAPGRDHDAQMVLGESATLVDAVQEGFAYGNNNHVDGPVVHNGGNALSEDKVETWSEEGKEFMKQNGLVCMSFVALTSLSAQPVTS